MDRVFARRGVVQGLTRRSTSAFMKVGIVEANYPYWLHKWRASKASIEGDTHGNRPWLKILRVVLGRLSHGRNVPQGTAISNPLAWISAGFSPSPTNPGMLYQCPASVIPLRLQTGTVPASSFIGLSMRDLATNPATCRAIAVGHRNEARRSCHRFLGRSPSRVCHASKRSSIGIGDEGRNRRFRCADCLTRG